MLLLLTPALLLAQAEQKPSPGSGPADAITSLLPYGSELEGVIFPRYDQRRRLTEVLYAESLQLVDASHLAGKTVTVKLYRPDGTQRGKADFVTVLLNRDDNHISTRDPVAFQEEKGEAKGAGLVYSLKKGEGFLLGPASVRIKAPPVTAMNAPAALGKAALIGAALTSAMPAAPPEFSEADRAALHADAAPQAPAAAAAAAAARSSLRSDLEAAGAATQAALTFLEQEQLLEETTGDAEPAKEPQPLEISPNPDDTVITGQGGVYHSSELGVFVFLKNIEVQNPEYSLTCDNELKAFYDKPPQEEASPEAASSEEPSDPLPLPSANLNIGEVSRLVATGNVHIIKKATADEPAVEVSGAIASYDIKNNLATVSGGYPWVKRGNAAFRAETANQTLRVDTTTGDFTFSGQYKAVLPRTELQRR